MIKKGGEVDSDRYLMMLKIFSGSQKRWRVTLVSDRKKTFIPVIRGRCIISRLTALGGSGGFLLAWRFCSSAFRFRSASSLRLRCSHCFMSENWRNSGLSIKSPPCMVVNSQILHHNSRRSKILHHKFPTIFQRNVSPP